VHYNHLGPSRNINIGKTYQQFTVDRVWDICYNGNGHQID